MDKIRFLHIPKTAGTSLSNCLGRIYKAHRSKDKVFVFFGDLRHDSYRYEQMEAAERSRITLVTGHAPLNTGLAEIDRLPTITLLRDPVERVKSLCQYIHEGKIGNLPPENFDLDAALANGNSGLTNMQARTLLGDRSYEFPVASPEILVERAIEVLTSRLASFGIAEYFGDSLLLFHQTLNWKTYPVYIRLNEKSRSGNVQFSSAQLERIRAANAIDIEIYERAVRIFQERMAARAAEIDARRRKFLIKQKLSQPFLGLYKLYHAGQSMLRGYRGKTGA